MDRLRVRSWRAVSRPRPALEPVTTADLPRRSMFEGKGVTFGWKSGMLEVNVCVDLMSELRRMEGWRIVDCNAATWTFYIGRNRASLVFSAGLQLCFVINSALLLLVRSVVCHSLPIYTT